ncbi:MAG: fructose-1,6-bisphosphatase II / sedoheptulose-1,7-bisphosphatase [Alphaproteobacteria bacterium]|nr:fructose-1,6-bisphosphatase II / sedoheptulose-1,7-bisphosphatase [Alphaproteobacteria bacterium]
MAGTKPILDRVFSMEIARVTEAAAIAASRLIGCGDEKAADQAAVDAMRTALNKLEMRGEIVIGEGERDEAPMLYIGEKVGTGNGPELDIALDPLEGTTITAKAMPNALAVVAFAEKGKMLNAPDVYMDKLAIGNGYAKGVVDLDKSPADNIRALAAAKGVPVQEITACVLDRPRHADIIKSIRSVGARIQLIPDGDVAGVIATTQAHTGIDIYMGSGGAPEGVLAAAALRCIGGQMQGRLLFTNDEQRDRARKMGVKDLNHKYVLEELAAGDVIFSATGVTDGSMLQGIHREKGGAVTTHTVVMRSATGTVRWIRARHLDESKFS